jgi:hypothetical protein
MDGAVVHDVVGGVDRVSVPLRPPSTQRVTHVAVGGVLQEEVCIVDAGSKRKWAVRIGLGEVQINSDEVPARSGCAGGYVGDEEEEVGAGSKRGGKECWGKDWCSRWQFG